MAPIKRKINKKLNNNNNNNNNNSTLKNLSNDSFLLLNQNQNQQEKEELSINKFNNNNSTTSPKKVTTTTTTTTINNNKLKGIQKDKVLFNNGMNLEEMKVMLEDFDLEAGAQIRSLTSKMEERLEQTKRQWKSSIENLDSKTSNLLYKDFLILYKGDFKLALQSITTKNLIPKLTISNLEQSVRKRKRVLDTPILSQQGDDSDDVFGVPQIQSQSLNNTTAKKARSVNHPPPPSSATKSRNAVASSSKSTVGGNRNLNSRNNLGTPRMNPPPHSKFNRLSIDPSTNFVYRIDGPLSLSQSHSTTTTTATATAPPTPHLGGSLNGVSVSASAIKRKPRRGESIIMLSVNDSPLGYLMADEVDDDDDTHHDADQEEEEEEEEEQEEEEGEEEGEEWDLMERHEASRVEEQGRVQVKGKGKGKGRSEGKGKLNKNSNQPQAELTSSAIRRSTRAAVVSTKSTSTKSTSSFNPSKDQQEFTFGTSTRVGGGGERGGGQGDFFRKMESYLDEMSIGQEAKKELREKFMGMF